MSFKLMVNRICLKVSTEKLPSRSKFLTHIAIHNDRPDNYQYIKYSEFYKRRPSHTIIETKVRHENLWNFVNEIILLHTVVLVSL